MVNKLLIVDDEPRIYHALRRALHRENWETLYAEGGEAALKVLEAEEVDIVIADQNMPGMNGSQLLGIARQRWPEVIRMMLTGDASMDVVVNAVNRGEIYRFFTKPANEAELIISIRDALQMKRLKTESMRLLDTVKRQAVRIRQLESGTPDTGADQVAAGPEPADGEVRATLDELTGRTPAASADAQAPATTPPADPNEVIDLDGSGGDVDALLKDIRNELDNILK